MGEWRMKRIEILLSSLLLTGCYYTAQCIDDSVFTPQMEPVPGYLWLTADNDATVVCDQVSTPSPSNCPNQYPGNRNFGTGPTVDLQWRNQTTERKRVYVRFYLPELPAGTQVIEARVNLFDLRPVASGNTDQVIMGSRAIGAWNAEQITWINQPNSATGLQQEFNLESRANEWSPSQDIAQLIVEPVMNGSEPNNGFMIHFFSTVQSFENGYKSDNTASRTENDLDDAPRLLLRLSKPTSCSALTLPNIPWSDTDLDASIGGPPLSPVLMVRTGHTSWPTNWNVPWPF
jgi:hypothetical protein